jgi:hypothetical protein
LPPLTALKTPFFSKGQPNDAGKKVQKGTKSQWNKDFCLEGEGNAKTTNIPVLR